MQIDNELKEILLDCWNNGSCYILYNKEKTFLDWLEENESKILALGKPEPLAKNKQTDDKCEVCGVAVGEEPWDMCKGCSEVEDFSEHL